MSEKGGMVLEEVNADSIVKKLLIVNDNPDDIWNAIETNIPGFFERILMKKYNLGPQFLQQLQEEFKEQVQQVEQEWKKKLYLTKDNFEQQLKIVNNALLEAEAQLKAVRLENVLQIEIVSEMIEQKLFNKKDEIGDMKYLEYLLKKEK